MDCLQFDRYGFVLEGDLTSPNLNFRGEVRGNFSEETFYSGKGKGFYSDGAIKIESLKDLSFIYDKKLVLQEGLFAVKEDGEKACEFFAKTIVFHDQGKKISLHGIEGRLKKKALKDKLNIELIDEELTFCAEADILPEQKDFWLSGYIGEKNYVVQEKEIKVESINFRGNKKAFIIDCDVPVYDTELNLCGHLFFDDKVLFQVDGFEKGKKVLVVDGSYKDEIEIFRCKGDLIGIEFDLTPSNELGKKGFAAQLNLDLQKMKPCLPLGFCRIY